MFLALLQAQSDISIFPSILYLLYSTLSSARQVFTRPRIRDWGTIHSPPLESGGRWAGSAWMTLSVTLMYFSGYLWFWEPITRLILATCLTNCLIIMTKAANITKFNVRWNMVIRAEVNWAVLISLRLSRIWACGIVAIVLVQPQHFSPLTH